MSLLSIGIATGGLLRTGAAHALHILTNGLIRIGIGDSGTSTGYVIIGAPGQLVSIIGVPVSDTTFGTGNQLNVSAFFDMHPNITGSQLLMRIIADVTDEPIFTITGSPAELLLQINVFNLIIVGDTVRDFSIVGDPYISAII